MIWLASYPKSGNTWVRLLLNAYLNESNDINNITVCVNDNKAYYYHSLSPRETLSYGEALLLRSAALLHMKNNGAKMLKTHHANARISGVELIPELLTERAVYIVRDPRDVVISMARHFGQTIDQSIDALGDPNRSLDSNPTLHYLGDWSRHVMSWAKAAFPVLVIRYEDLMSNTIAVLTDLLPFLNISPDPERISMAVELTQFETLQRIESETGFNEKSQFQDRFFSRAGSTWRDDLTPEQQHRIEQTHSEVMTYHGYQFG